MSAQRERGTVAGAKALGGIIAALLAACGGLVQGFDTGAISNASASIVAQFHLTSGLQGVVKSMVLADDLRQPRDDTMDGANAVISLAKQQLERPTLQCLALGRHRRGTSDAQNGDIHLAGVRGAPMLKNKDPLPGSQGHLSTADGDDLVCPGKRHSQMACGIVWTFQRVHVVGVFGGDPLEEGVEVGPGARIGVFVDHKTRAGMA
jgi:hypothetical protein